MMILEADQDMIVREIVDLIGTMTTVIDAEDVTMVVIGIVNRGQTDILETAVIMVDLTVSVGE